MVHWILNIGFHALPIVALVLLYGLLIQYRQWRWKRLARELGAVFISEGLLKTGRIEGHADGRDYAIFTNVSWSSILLRAANPGMPFGVMTECFADFPDWRFAFTVGVRPASERIPRLVPPQALLRLPEPHQPAFVALFRPFVDDVQRSQALGSGAFWFLPTLAEFRCNGMIRGRDRVLAALRLLSVMADQVERNPII